MTVEELRREAKALGYNIIRNPAHEKLLPCVCGCKRRSHWYGHIKGTDVITLRCKGCDRSASGRNEEEVRRNWNKLIRLEKQEVTT